MWDRILTVLSSSTLVLAGSLLLNSGLNQLAEPRSFVFSESVQFYLATGLLAVSATLLVCLLAATRHAFYEYWIVIAGGLIVGVVYVF